MERNLDDRAYELAVYMLEHDATVRAAAAKFGVSKSTVHMAVTITSGSYGVLNEKRPQDLVEIKEGRSRGSCPLAHFSDFRRLKEHCHIQRQMTDPILAHKVFGIEDKRLPELGRKLLSEFIQ